MRTTTRTVHHFELDPSEWFAFAKANSPFEGEPFMVHEVSLDIGPSGMSVHLRGPWIGADPAGAEGRQGWTFLFDSSRWDMDRVRDLSPAVQDVLEMHGFLWTGAAKSEGS